MFMWLNVSAIQKSKAIGKLITDNSVVFKSTLVRMTSWEAEKSKFLAMAVDEKRNLYKKQHYTISDIPTWKEYAHKEKLASYIPLLPTDKIDATKNAILAEKISVFRGDITTLEVDSIVNAANSSLLGGGGVDGAIHRAAGPNLVQECKTLNGCNVGEAKMTGAYHLPSKYVIHTVGPKGEQTNKLTQCYQNALDVMHSKKLRSIAFPCISTGIYGYPNKPAAHVAINQVRNHLEQNAAAVDRIIFCLFMEEDVVLYEGILQSYFPLN